MIECALLGEPVVTIDGGTPPPEFLWRKHLSLFAYLLLTPGHSSTREQLVGLLWAEKSESAARHSLREAMRHVRRVVGDEGLVAAQDRVTLVADVQLDLDRFRTHTSGANWTAAAALVRGPLLDGLEVPDAPAFEDWLAQERRAWAAPAVEALVSSARAAMREGRVRDAAAATERALTIDPLADAAVEVLLCAQTLQGSRGVALDVWSAYETRWREVGGEPPRHLRALVARLRAGHMPAPADAPAVAPSSRRTPFVGRAEPLHHLLGAWQAARDRPGALFAVIEGVPGVGRSRMLAECAARVGLAGGDVATLRAVRADAGEAWSGLMGILRGGLANAEGVGGAQPAALARLAADVPEWAGRAGARADIAGTDLPAAAREALGAAWDARPVFLAIDDAQWLDPQTLGWLEQVLRDADRAPCTVCCTVTAGETAALDAIRTGLPGRAQLQVRLDPLTEADLAALAGETHPSWTAEQHARVARRLVTDTGGRPLLAVEMLHALSLGADVPATWPAPERTMEQTFPGDLPGPVVAAIRVGVRALPPLEQDILGVLAVRGGPIAPDAITAAVRGAPETATALDRLEWSGWVTAVPRGYALTSRVVQDVFLTDLLTPGQIRRLAEA